jgi:hypothetical protein
MQESCTPGGINTFLHVLSLLFTSVSPKVQGAGLAVAMQDSGDGGKGGKRPAWGRKQEVIEGVNELIDELKDIDNAIANQVRTAAWNEVDRRRGTAEKAEEVEVYTRNQSLVSYGVLPSACISMNL